ncbi:Uncharacterized protein APZ42_002163, partial [Daphnia magna]
RALPARCHPAARPRGSRLRAQRHLTGRVHPRKPRGHPPPPGRPVEGRTHRPAEGRGRRIRGADGAPRGSRVAEARQGIHLPHLQRLRRRATLDEGSRGEAEVDRPRDVRALAVLRGLRQNLRPRTQRGRPAAPPVGGLQGPRPDRPADGQDRGTGRGRGILRRPPAHRRFQPARRVGKAPQPRLRPAGGPPARRAQGRRLHPQPPRLHPRPAQRRLHPGESLRRRK